MQDDTDAFAVLEAQERRSYIRAQDAVGLHVQKITDLPAAGQSSRSVEPSKKVRKRDKYEIEGYAEVRGNYPAVVQYITDLEERIRELLLDADTPVSKPTHKVSLSAGGVRFTDKTRHVPGETISLMITLFPSGVRLGSDAVIVSVGPGEDTGSADASSYRAVFIRISDSDREIIENHVQQLLSKRLLLED